MAKQFEGETDKLVATVKVGKRWTPAQKRAAKRRLKAAQARMGAIGRRKSNRLRNKALVRHFGRVKKSLLILEKDIKNEYRHDNKAFKR